MGGRIGKVLLAFVVLFFILENVYGSSEYSFKLSYLYLLSRIFLIVTSAFLIYILIRSFEQIPKPWLIFIIFLLFWIIWSINSAVIQAYFLSTNTKAPDFMFYADPFLFLISAILLAYGFKLMRGLVT